MADISVGQVSGLIAAGVFAGKSLGVAADSADQHSAILHTAGSADSSGCLRCRKELGGHLVSLQQLPNVGLQEQVGAGPVPSYVSLAEHSAH